MTDDLISRQAAIDAVNKICDRCGEHKKYDGVMCGTCYLDGVADIIEDLPSAQQEQSNASEFWRKRADFYSDMCMNLIGEMGKGVKIESVKISENGIEFIKGQPSVQLEIIHCKDCTRYGKDNCFMKIQMLWELKPDDFCSYAERRTDEQID